MPARAAATAAQPTPMPAAQNVTPTPQGAAAEPTGPRFTGHPVSLDFQGADLRAVLRTFAEISGLNVVIDPTITGSVDVSLRDVPWDQALDIILKANKLGYYVDGSIVRIAPLGVLADEEAQRRKLAEEQALAGRAARVHAAAELRQGRRPHPHPHPQRAVGARRGPGGSAHQHHHHPRPARSPDRGGRADGDTRPAPAAGGDRGPHRPDQPRLRPQPGRSVGHQRAGVAGTGQHHAAGLPEQRQHHRPHRHRPGPRPHAHRREPGRGQRQPARSAWRSARSMAPSISTSP